MIKLIAFNKKVTFTVNSHPTMHLTFRALHSIIYLVVSLEYVAKNSKTLSKLKISPYNF